MSPGRTGASGCSGVGNLEVMTIVGLLTFFGLAVITMDVLGGVIAATFLARGMKPRHLLFFLGGYALSVIIVTIALKPILRHLGEWLAPVLGSATWLAVAQIVVGLALIGFAAFQRHGALHPKVHKEAATRDQTGSLITGGLLLSLTTFADPTFTVAVGLAMQTHDLVLEILLLVVWNVIYQLPLISIVVAAQFGLHARVLDAFGRFFGSRRKVIMLTFAAVLALGGLVVIGDGIVALASEHRPWLQSLLLMHR